MTSFSVVPWCYKLSNKKESTVKLFNISMVKQNLCGTICMRCLLFTLTKNVWNDVKTTLLLQNRVEETSFWNRWFLRIMIKLLRIHWPFIPPDLTKVKANNVQTSIKSLGPKKSKSFHHILERKSQFHKTPPADKVDWTTCLLKWKQSILPFSKSRQKSYVCILEICYILSKRRVEP